MGRMFRFRGETVAVDVTAALNGSAALRGFRSRIAAMRLRGGRRIGDDAAQHVLERLLVQVLEHAGTQFTGRAGRHLDAIQRIRTDLAARYNEALALFRPGAPRVRSLPERIRPAEFERLFRELDEHMDALEQSSSRRGMNDAFDHVDQTHSAETLLAEAEGRRAGVDPVSPHELPPDLDLDSPDADFTWRPRGEHDRAALAHYRERMRLVPESQALRGRVRADGVEWASRALPEGCEVTLYRVPDYSEGNLAALARFRDLDPNFSGRGYELQIRLPDGTRVRPDGIRFLTPEGRRYQFLESKEPYTWGEGNFYNTEAGQRSLRGMLDRDARIAQTLRGSGCEGFLYQTGHPDLDAFMAAQIAEMRAAGVPGADLLSAPGH